jgi:mRNA interferase RelE/StbE
VGDKVGLWRYRIGDYRMICKIEDEIVTVVMLSISHRKDIYN